MQYLSRQLAARAAGSLLILAGLMSVAVEAREPCGAGGGCSTFASYSPLTDDTEWETWCDDGFYISGIINGNGECIMCLC